jgi:hypothetical protein
MRTVLISVAEVKRETPLAFLFVLPGDADGVGLDCEDERERIWVPKSVIDDEGEGIEAGDEDIEVNVAEWFAEKEGLA